MKNFILLAGVAVIVAGGAYVYLSQQNGQNPFSGTTSEQSTSANHDRSQTNAGDKANSITGVYCHTDDADRTLAVHKEDGSPDITFGVSYWFANGHSCGISGEAKLMADQQWLFVYDMMNGSKCGLTIEANNDGSMKVIESENKCIDLCGGGVNFNTATFPANSKYKDTVNKEDVMQASELALCP